MKIYFNLLYFLREISGFSQNDGCFMKKKTSWWQGELFQRFPVYIDGGVRLPQVSKLFSRR